MISAAGKYKFKAVQGNTDWSVGNVKKTAVLWETFGTDVMPTVGDLIADTGYKDGYVYFSTPETFANGNASIAVRNSKDVILWSWHIWCTEEGWIDHVYANNAGTMMDRNLGATSATPGDVGAFGLLYQWGRKDPFLGSCSLSEPIFAASTGTWETVNSTKTINYSEENPTTFIAPGVSDWCTGAGAHSDNYNLRWKGSEKTMYDPCPVGYQVPKGGENGFWATALGTSTSTTAGIYWEWDWTNKGSRWLLADSETTAWYPAIGNRLFSGSGLLSEVGTLGYYWSGSNSNSSNTDVPIMRIHNYSVDNNQTRQRAAGLAVRCVRE